MLVCNICKKKKDKGIGKELFIVAHAFSYSDDGKEFSVTFEHESKAWIGRGKNIHAICGTCLQKLGVIELIQEDIKREKEQVRDAATLNVGKKQLNVGQKQLNEGQKQLNDGFKLQA